MTLLQSAKPKSQSKLNGGNGENCEQFIINERSKGEEMTTGCCSSPVPTEARTFNCNADDDLHQRLPEWIHPAREKKAAEARIRIARKVASVVNALRALDFYVVQQPWSPEACCTNR